MKATIASITQSRIAECITAEDLIVYKARVSSPNQRSEEADKLLQYLVFNNHWSPFDMVDLCIEIETSRGIMAQVLRHWSFRFQEFSQRYSTTKMGHEAVEIRKKHVDGNRQGSAQADLLLSGFANQVCYDAAEEYQSLIADGSAPECARFVLPLATTTRAYMKGSVRSWMTYFWQRLDSHAQKEHRELAWLCFRIFEKEFPLIAALVLKGKPTFNECDWAAPQQLNIELLLTPTES